MMKSALKNILAVTFMLSAIPAFSIPKGTIESRSTVNWVTRKFISNITMDTKKAQLVMPSGKKQATAAIQMKLPQLVQDPLLYLYADSTKRLADFVITKNITLPQVQDFISGGYRTPEVFSNNGTYLNTTNTLNIDELGKILIKHKYPYSPEQPIEDVPSRAYTGIIIDARGKLTVHGEYVKDNTYPCFFPKIWDENMNTIYERSMVDPSVVSTQGLVSFDFRDDTSNCLDRVGSDPLYIKATEVFGRNRTDPVIRRSDALKILTVPENVELLKQGKVIVLLDKEQLIYDVAIPEKDELYYAKYEEAKRHMLTTVIPDTELVTDEEGFKYIVKLNFYPDSSKLLPGEEVKIKMIAEDLKNIILDDGYTILIEGHTADVGKPAGQLNLSIERAQAVLNAINGQGIPKNIMSYKGCGGTLPVASNDTEEGRSQNRRVEIIARPRATYIQRDW